MAADIAHERRRWALADPLPKLVATAQS